MRSFLLAAAQSGWLRNQAPRYRFVRRTVSRFMPGEEIGDALAAARTLRDNGIGTVLTQLGENVADASEAAAVVDHYVEVLDRIRAESIPAEISVKPTHLGLDLGASLCRENLRRLLAHSAGAGTVWVDMESSEYVDRTLDLYRQVRGEFQNVGVCVQAYLYRTEDDLKALLPLGPSIRLVKGAYKEPDSIAFPRKKDVDENFFMLARMLLGPDARSGGVRAAMATHDDALIRRIRELAKSEGIANQALEFQMLYGIQRPLQLQLAKDGYRSIVLISYGAYWFPWFMRRLAERPANVLFILRNMFSG